MSKETKGILPSTPHLDKVARDMATQDSKDIYEANKEEALQFYGMPPYEYMMSLEARFAKKDEDRVLKDFDSGRKSLLSRFREVFRRETEGRSQ